MAPSPKDVSKVIILVNGEKENAGKETHKKENGKSVVEVNVKSDVIKEKIEQVLKEKKKDTKNIVEVPVADTKSEKARVALTGDIVKELQEENFTVSVDKNNIQYNIPAEEFTIELVAKKLDVDRNKLQDIEVNVEIAKVSDDVVEKYEKVAKANKNEIVVPPVEFRVSAKTKKANGESEIVEISKFENYVERVIQIPEGVDPSKITTGIVFNPDGTYSHVPTEVFEKGGKYFAKLNSLTNSTYSVIWNPLTVESVDGHWSEGFVNDMASRLVIVDTEGFEPDTAITRAEFADYIVRALGLYREGEKISKDELKFSDIFSDINEEHPFVTSITIANDWEINY